MQSLFAESPILVCSILAVFAGSLCFVWLKTGSKSAGIGGLICLVLIPGEVFLESAWVTEKERLRETIQEVATFVEANDLGHLEAYFHPNQRSGWNQAPNELPRYEFSEARVTGYRSILVREDLNPPEAFADFTVFLIVSVQNAGRDFRVPRRVRVAFRKIDDRWLVIGYEHMPTMGKLDTYATQGAQGEMPAWIADYDGH